LRYEGSKSLQDTQKDIKFVSRILDLYLHRLLLKMSHSSSNDADQINKARILELRNKHIGANVSLHFASSNPLLVLKGEKEFLFDENGSPYLDCVNNVAHVGHCHPHVVAATAKQCAELNTNSRYLHPALVDYSARLTKTFPKESNLEIVFWVNSGSEANDLALRLAKAHTKKRGVICVEAAYSGHTDRLIGISPYKYDRKGGVGRPKSWVKEAPLPDVYTGKFRGDITDDAMGKAYAAEVDKLLDEYELDIKAEKKLKSMRDARMVSASADGVQTKPPSDDDEARALRYLDECLLQDDGLSTGCGAFIMESILSCGGQVMPPAGYLKRVYASVRKHGGICIADEVQVGFGRVGSAFWGFELQGSDIFPDIVTVGKPIGNGFPVAAVITTREIAKSFDNGMEYFNTFGGNPVAATVAGAVLDVIEREKLQENALKVGKVLIDGFNELYEEFASAPVCIGSVRGTGLMVGLECIKGERNGTREPDGECCIAVKLHAYSHHKILLSTDGMFDQVIKLKPPMCFTEEDAKNTCKAIRDGLLLVKEKRMKA
jgi:4-aminobutyrate aminotransferase-like enzyme